MSSSFPRVAPRTRPPQRRVAKLPPLPYGIYNENGQLVKVNEVPDPRTAICAAFNEQAAPFKMVALPIVAESEVDHV